MEDPPHLEVLVLPNLANGLLVQFCQKLGLQISIPARLEDPVQGDNGRWQILPKHERQRPWKSFEATNLQRIEGAETINDLSTFAAAVPNTSLSANCLLFIERKEKKMFTEHTFLPEDKTFTFSKNMHAADSANLSDQVSRMECVYHTIVGVSIYHKPLGELSTSAGHHG
jgi:hypothetical protein